MAFEREIDCSYADPLDLVWLKTAERLGMTVSRSSEVFAEWDGQGTLRIADAGSMDPDDSVAQLVFHETCHALVEGPDAWELPDWGLVNRDDRHLGREHACHRLQAALADRHGLRRFLAVTTEHRPHYDALPADPLVGDAPTAAVARCGWERATTGPWAETLDEALRTTALLARALRGFAADGSLWLRAESGPGQD
jgi:hypothetical protein